MSCLSDGYEVGGVFGVELKGARSDADHIHFPFCASKCLYCNFNSYSNKNDLQLKYFQSLIKEISKYNNQYVQIIGLLKANKIIKTKKGDLMNIATFVDENGAVSAIMFPKTYTEYSNILSVGKYYALKGKIEIEESSSSMIVDSIKEYVIKE